MLNGFQVGCYADVRTLTADSTLAYLCALVPSINAEGNFMTTSTTLYGWHGFDFMGFSVAGWIAERRPAHWPRFDYWTENGELLVRFGRREVVITPPWWRPRGGR
jgi:hypothetical protein